MSAPVDTSAEAVEAMARTHDLVRFTLGMRSPEHDETAALLRALLRERDEARAQSRMWQEACGEHGGRYWEARCRDAEAARDTAEAALATARADALREAYAAMDSLPDDARLHAERRLSQLIKKEPRA